MPLLCDDGERRRVEVELEEMRLACPGVPETVFMIKELYRTPGTPHKPCTVVEAAGMLVALEKPGDVKTERKSQAQD